MKTILSYPRSGNHLVRFFIELLTENPTLGYKGNSQDIPIFLNKFPEEIPFNITSLDKFNQENLYRKFHNPPSSKETPTELLFIVRNPREVLIRNLDYKFKIDGWDGCKTYFECIDYFNYFNGKKIIFYYEDICTNKIKFIEELCVFLELTNPDKKKYVTENIEKLYELSKQGKNRCWGGINSNNMNYYYNRINDNEKELFDNYISSMIETDKYNLIKNKYNL